MAPHLGALVPGVEGQITDDTDSALVGVLLEPGPLFVKHVLVEDRPLDGIAKFAGHAVDLVWVPITQRRGPFRPAFLGKPFR